MFGSNKNKENHFAKGGTTLLARSVEILGDIKFAGNLEIEGVVKGNIFAEKGMDARVRIMEKGQVTGNIHAPKVIINGDVNGDVHADKHLELAANAVVNGNVHYQVIEMVKGAQVNGNMVFENTQHPAPKDSASAPKTPSNTTSSNTAIKTAPGAL